MKHTLPLKPYARKGREDESEQMPTTSSASLVARHFLADQQGISARLTAVYEIGVTISRLLDVHEILDEVKRHARRAFNFEHCSVCLRGHDTAVYSQIKLIDIVDDPDYFDPAIYNSVWRALRGQQPQLANDTRATTPNAYYLSHIVIPLQSENEALGTLSFASREKFFYSQDDLQLANMLALQLAIAIRNAWRFQEIKSLYGRLELAYRDLLNAERKRDELVEMIIHDLRNPLTVIDTYIQLLNVAANDISSLKQLADQSCHALSASRTVMELIDDILDVSKLDGGALQPVLSPVDFHDWLEHKTHTFRLQARHEGKRFLLTLPEKSLTVLMDKSLIGRVLDNLISNAFKYTQRDGVIEVAASVVGKTLSVTVRDDGAGIPADYHSQIFQKYGQVKDGKSAPLRKGMGLGLAFCRMAVQAHQGQIWVESADGQGSAFTFTLPLTLETPE